MSSLIWIILYILLFIALLVCVDFIRRYYNRKYNTKQQTVLLELTPPVVSRKSPDATEHLFSVLYNLGRMVSQKDKFLGRSRLFSFEVIATRREGIRFMVQLAENDTDSFEQQLASYLPDVRFKIVKDPLDRITGKIPVTVTEFHQARHFAYPLSSHDALITKNAKRTGKSKSLVIFNKKLIFGLLRIRPGPLPLISRLRILFTCLDMNGDTTIW